MLNSLISVRRSCAGGRRTHAAIAGWDQNARQQEQLESRTRKTYKDVSLVRLSCVDVKLSMKRWLGPGEDGESVSPDATLLGEGDVGRRTMKGVTRTLSDLSSMTSPRFQLRSYSAAGVVRCG